MSENELRERLSRDFPHFSRYRTDDMAHRHFIVSRIEALIASSSDPSQARRLKRWIPSELPIADQFKRFSGLLLRNGLIDEETLARIPAPPGEKMKVAHSNKMVDRRGGGKTNEG